MRTCLVFVAIFTLVGVNQSCSEEKKTVQEQGTCNITDEGSGLTWCYHFPQSIELEEDQAGALRNSCITTQGGTWTDDTGSCATTDAVGQCTFSSDGNSVVAFYYPPFTEETSQTSCENQGGGVFTEVT